MDAETKKAVYVRLHGIHSQVQGVERMVDADRYCIDLMHQLAVVQAANGKAADVVLRSHVQTCRTRRGFSTHSCGLHLSSMIVAAAMSFSSTSVVGNALHLRRAHL